MRGQIYERDFWGDGSIHYLDGGDDIMGEHMLPINSKPVQFPVCQLHLDIGVEKT